ncbi:MAG: 16S rRNA (adenine(1518)-N(6)/adenine(1519)-N(6))-dimethyltransferase RsmA [Polyangiaceae bacterium]|jgi:16S rRNA (adenine1518-N6/adenine1519-N6)-dimethyltransferase
MIDARALLREASLSPKKSFGQNFLVAERIVRAIAEACVPEGELGRARVLELGAGLGALTSELLTRAAHVVAVERDRDLVPILSRALHVEVEAGKLTILEADAQSVNIPSLLGDGGPRVLCGNLPYQITGRLLQLAVTSAAAVDRVVFMVQDEVAERLVASPGTKDYGALTVFVRAAFDVTRLFKVSRGSFHPQPDVTSSVVRLVPVRPPRAEETEAFRALVKGAFGMRRKTLRNAWGGVASAETIARVAAEAQVSLDARGETLSVEDFARVAAALDRAAP